METAETQVSSLKEKMKTFEHEIHLVRSLVRLARDRAFNQEGDQAALVDAMDDIGYGLETALEKIERVLEGQPAI